MHAHTNSRGGAGLPALAGLAALALGLVSLPNLFAESDASEDAAGTADAVEGGSEAEAAVEPPPEPVSTPEAATLRRCGLDPEALCAAGLSSADTTGVVEDALAYLDANPGELSGADATYAAARVEKDQLVRTVKSGLATEQEVSDCQTALSDFAAAEQARQDAIDAIVAAAEADLTTGEKALLATIRGNRHWNLPVEYFVVDRTEADWVHLRECLANERISADYGEEPDEDLQADLGSIESDPAVAGATADLDANLATTISAWNAALT